MRLLIVFLMLVVVARTATAQPMTTQLIASGQPYLFVTAPPNDTARLFLVSQSGNVRVFDLNSNQLLTAPFVTVPGGGGEAGLLGMAFHPNYAHNGMFYVYYATGSVRMIARYHVNSATPNVADAASATTILSVSPSGAGIHYGGWIGFGPDGHLYIAWGNGATANAQNIVGNLFGMMLRLDINGPDGVPGTADDDGFPANTLRNYHIPAGNPYVGVTGEDEIWFSGLRNPFRCSFDRATGDLWIADVGDSREEIDLAPAGHAGGLNFGYPCRDGNVCVSGAGCVPCPAPGPYTSPVFPYQRTGGASAVIGGHVYRGCELPVLRGRYIFGDYGQRFIWSFRWNGTATTQFEVLTSQLPNNSLRSFGEDARGELYMCHSNGVYRIVPVTRDCNGNTLSDGCEIVAGTVPDVNANGVIDSCERPWPCNGDFDQDGDVGSDADIEAFFECLAGRCCAVCGQDFNGDGDGGTDGDIEAFFRVLAGNPC